MTETDLARRVETVRHFNRFFTRQIGVLQETLLHSPFSLTEARVVYELAHHERTTATELGSSLGLDPGYLSRILRNFKRQGLIEKETAAADGRQNLLWLTEKGREAFAKLNSRSQREIEAMLAGLSEEEQDRLTEAMHTIEGVLSAPPETGVAYILRPPQPGDMGWVIQRHGALYTQEYGWDETFEGLVAEIVGKFVLNFDPKRERCWIAEKDGVNVGSIFLVKQSETVAKLRLLLVEPSARGLGIGERLVAECVRAARQLGYEKITLWTNDVLHAARHIYEKTGFHLVHEGPRPNFGKDLVEQTWEMPL